MKEDHFNVNIFAIFVQKILEEMWDGLVGDVPTYDDVPDGDVVKKRETDWYGSS
jgi:hypothetical protein